MKFRPTPLCLLFSILDMWWLLSVLLVADEACSIESVPERRQPQMGKRTGPRSSLRKSVADGATGVGRTQLCWPALARASPSSLLAWPWKQASRVGLPLQLLLVPQINCFRPGNLLLPSRLPVATPPLDSKLGSICLHHVPGAEPATGTPSLSPAARCACGVPSCSLDPSQSSLCQGIAQLSSPSIFFRLLSPIVWRPAALQGGWEWRGVHVEWRGPTWSCFSTVIFSPTPLPSCRPSQVLTLHSQGPALMFTVSLPSGTQDSHMLQGSPDGMEAVW